jgi:protein-disulfide isomerase
MAQVPPHALTPPVGDRDHRRGPATARVTLVEYADFECPYCRAALPILGDLRRRLADQLCVVFRHFPLTARHPHAQHAAEAAEAAGAQGRFWAMHDRLFAQQQALAAAPVRRHAEALGLDLARFDRELAAHAHGARVRVDVESGRASGVDGTPTFFLDGARYDGPVTLEALLATIRRAHPDLAGDFSEPGERPRIPRVQWPRSPGV